VVRHIEEARALKPGLIQLVDRVLVAFVPVVLGAAALAIVVRMPGDWLVTGNLDVTRAIFSALAVLVMGYPCALAMMRGGGMAAERGILMRSGEAFQVFQDIDVVVFDKTGTLTSGKPVVAVVVPVAGGSEEELLLPRSVPRTRWLEPWWRQRRTVDSRCPTRRASGAKPARECGLRSRAASSPWASPGGWMPKELNSGRSTGIGRRWSLRPRPWWLWPGTASCLVCSASRTS
jgi:magnesium-transporting ATPase (P-type)